MLGSSQEIEFSCLSDYGVATEHPLCPGQSGEERAAQKEERNGGEGISFSSLRVGVGTVQLKQGGSGGGPVKPIPASKKHVETREKEYSGRKSGSIFMPTFSSKRVC